MQLLEGRKQMFALPLFMILGVHLIIIITTLFAILFLSANQRCNPSTQQLL